MKTAPRKSREIESETEAAGKELDSSDGPRDLEGNSNEHTSESPNRPKCDICSEGDEPEVKPFRPVDPHVFVKASRKYLAQNPPEASHLVDFASGLGTVQLRACKSQIDKQSRAFEYYLIVVTSMYYGDPFIRAKEPLPISKDVCKVPRRHGEKGRDSVLNTLVSPLRRPFNFESWTPREIAIFEAGLCAFGKRFEKVSALLNHCKTIAQITNLYYDWKTTSHYKFWKEAVMRENWDC
jgi:hypothetical protein